MTCCDTPQNEWNKRKKQKVFCSLEFIVRGKMHLWESQSLWSVGLCSGKGLASCSSKKLGGKKAPQKSGRWNTLSIFNTEMDTIDFRISPWHNFACHDTAWIFLHIFIAGTMPLHTQSAAPSVASWLCHRTTDLWSLSCTFKQRRVCTHIRHLLLWMLYRH